MPLLAVRIPADLHSWVQERGGAAYVRQLLERERERSGTEVALAMGWSEASGDPMPDPL